MKALHIIAFILVIVGALNWLLIGAFNWNLVTWVTGGSMTAANAIYVIVGIAALWLLAAHKKDCKVCGS